MHFKLAFIGYGVVAQGLTEILLEKKDMLEKKYNFKYKYFYGLRFFLSIIFNLKQ